MKKASTSLASSGRFRGSRYQPLTFLPSTFAASAFTSTSHVNFGREALSLRTSPWTRDYGRTNTIVNFVPQQEAWVVERFGKFLKVLEPGLRILLPFVDSIAYVQSLKVVTMEVANQVGVTKDNVSITINGVLYYQVVDPYMASYHIQDPEFAITQLAMSTMRVEVGKLTLDKTFEEREQMNANIVSAINSSVANWGLNCLRYEIRDIVPPERAKEAMELQMVAERRRRQTVIRSEAIKTAAINRAEGKKQSMIIKAEGMRRHKELVAAGEAEAIKVKAIATAEAIAKVASAIEGKKGTEAVALSVAEKYVEAFGKLAKESNTVLLPTNTGDVGSMVAQALTIFDTISNKRRSVGERGSSPLAGQAAAVNEEQQQQQLADLQQQQEEQQLQEQQEQDDEEDWQQQQHHQESTEDYARRGGGERPAPSSQDLNVTVRA